MSARTVGTMRSGLRSRRLGERNDFFLHTVAGAFFRRSLVCTGGFGCGIVARPSPHLARAQACLETCCGVAAHFLPVRCFILDAVPKPPTCFAVHEPVSVPHWERNWPAPPGTFLHWSTARADPIVVAGDLTSIRLICHKDQVEA